MAPSRQRISLLVFFAVACVFSGSLAKAHRHVISLDGIWQIAEGSMERMPQEFTGQIPVPGLVDMAKPAFDEVGKKSDLREAFWYRHTFSIEGPVPPVAILKIHKAKYGTKVFLNGAIVGQHLPCFTPVDLDVKKYLKGNRHENELTIRVGAGRESLPKDMPSGWDFEKYRYIPGIYDSVDLILTGRPLIRNVQTAPDIVNKTIRIVAEIQSGHQPRRVRLIAQVTESASGVEVGTGKSPTIRLAPNETKKIDLVIPIKNCRLWSPEDPFLYRALLHTEAPTEADSLEVRFGMREFRFDPVTKRAFLNGKPYFMRGTNVCAHRFFEDAARGDRPWRAQWVRRLHRQFKTMHWNSIRYCIGFPPDFWYDIADEEGFLIQDEFPIWLGANNKAPENPIAEKIIPEYTQWMRERWNHPCVVIWDAQNESITAETGKALRAVRELDLSHRPWENGWAEPQSDTDCIESHPYFFIRHWAGKEPFRLKYLAEDSGAPRLKELQKTRNVPIIINEYAWLWLDRNGDPTSLTREVYEDLLGKRSTAKQRQMLHARYLAALTEFWRTHRQSAGVLEFCGLGYSRSGEKPRPEGGATSDHFVDLETLEYEPHFLRYVRDAFNPVGLMLDFWVERLPCGVAREIKVILINDREDRWQGDVRLQIIQGDRIVRSQSQSSAISGLGRTVLTFTESIPERPGDYTLVAEFTASDGRRVQSLRDFHAEHGKE